MSRDRWEESRRSLRALGAAPSLEECRALVARYPRHAPDFFRFTSRDRDRAIYRAFKDGDGYASRLSLLLERPALFTLHAHHLGLSEEDADPRRIFNRATLRRWKRALRRVFRGACYFKFEAGARIHVHVIADESDGSPNWTRGGEVVKLIYDLEGLVSYLAKPPLPYTGEGLFIYLEGKRRLGRLPRLSGTFNLPRSVAPEHPSSLRVSNCSEPSSPPLEASPEEPHELPPETSSEPLRSSESSAFNPPRPMPHRSRRSLSPSASALATTSERRRQAQFCPVRLPPSRRARPPPPSLGICTHSLEASSPRRRNT